MTPLVGREKYCFNENGVYVSRKEDWVKRFRRVSLTRRNTKIENFMIDAFIWLIITPFIWLFFIVFVIPEFIFGSLLNLIQGKGFDKEEFKEMINFFK